MSDRAGLDAARYLRTELLERIAHELRGPAGVTLGALDELEHALDGAQIEQNKVLLAMARRGARRVLRTAERLTRTAQLEAGSQIVKAPADVAALVAHAIGDAELIEGRSSVRVKTCLPAEPCVAEVDSTWLSLALGELVSQAIRCARRHVEVTIKPEDGAIVVSVEDDRTAVMDAPSARFVSLADRRDAALGWPLVCDVAKAHGATLDNDVLHSETGAVKGLRLTLRLSV